ncbi:hypothetical protein CMUS01_07156 [Colletotrichum musicola]|uniref:Uncharacterized protein n=1 Tax=Colletotrichum musicola TaxID=2175873 RepID=A0A8H6NFQ4_9PEZI|nr:hypothetical protein CMUS01_07156 [Colletotrichum musicola]
MVVLGAATLGVLRVSNARGSASPWDLPSHPSSMWPRTPRNAAWRSIQELWIAGAGRQAGPSRTELVRIGQAIPAFSEERFK